MNLKKIVIFLLINSNLIVNSQNEQHTHKSNRTIDFPNIVNYKTLKTDLHIHSVFSDGFVWPNIRVQEALRDGLDAISVTEHIEYQPHSADIPHKDRNRSFEIAHKEAKDHKLIVTNGSEITRSMPPGHVNAVFIKDANALIKDDPIAVFREAKKQGAFIFWNHPHWIAQRKDGVVKLTEMHKKLIKENLLHGIEVVNEHTYSDEALQLALDKNLTIMGTSDIHGLIDWEFDIPNGGHRPVTLVFAKEKTEASLKQALFDGRTAVWHNNTLIGKETYIKPLVKACLTIEKVSTLKSYKGDSFVQEVVIKNTSDVAYIVLNKSDYNLHSDADVFTIKPHSSFKLLVKTLKKVTDFKLTFEILNAVIAPKKHATISFDCKLK